MPAITYPTCACPNDGKVRARSYYEADKDTILAQRREYYAANRDRIMARTTDYAKKHAPKIKAEAAARYAANREQNRASRRAHYKATRNAALARGRAWAVANRQKTREAARRWRSRNRELANLRSARCREANPEKYRILVATAVARRRSQTHQNLDQRVEGAFFAQAKRLTLTTGVPHHIDHIIPLSAGGWHHHQNLQVLPASVNLSKNDDPFWEMPGYKSWRDVPRELWPENLRDAYVARSSIAA